MIKFLQSLTFHFIVACCVIGLTVGYSHTPGNHPLGLDLLIGLSGGLGISFAARLLNSTV